MRLPEGWGPHISFLVFSLCTSSPITGPLCPELGAETAGVGTRSKICKSWVCGMLQASKQRPQPPRGSPSTHGGGSFSPGETKGQLRGSPGLRRGEVSTTSPPTLLLGFGHGGGPWSWPWGQAQHSGDIQHTQQAKDWQLPCPRGEGRTHPLQTDPAFPSYPLPAPPSSSHLPGEEGEKLRC